MTKNQVLAFVAATLLGAFWVYPGLERSKAPVRRPTTVTVTQPSIPVQDPAPRAIQRKKTTIKPVRIKKTITAKPARTKRSAHFSKRAKSKYEKADRRPSSLPLKKIRPKRDTIASK